MTLHHVLPLALAAAIAAETRTDQRDREKFSRRRMRQRRPIPIAAAALALLTVPLFADTDDGNLLFDGGEVISLRGDEFRDGYFVAIEIGTLDLDEGGVVVMEFGDLYAVMFEPHSFSSRDAEQVTFRIDRSPVLTLDGFWTDEHFCFAVDGDDFLDLLIGMERLIYRIGDGATLKVMIPEEIEEAVAFFRRQVALQSGRQARRPSESN